MVTESPLDAENIGRLDLVISGGKNIQKLWEITEITIEIVIFPYFSHDKW
jgi:hypothetical protein